MFSLQEIPPAFLSDPYPFYHMLRGLGPVVQEPAGRWLVSDYQLASATLRDKRFLVKNVWTCEHAGLRQQNSFARMEAVMLLHRDGADHSRLRALVGRAFTPKLIAELAPAVHRTTDALIDAVKFQGQMDVIANLASPLPVAVLAEMLGVPPEDLALFRGWSRELARVDQYVRLNDGPIPPDDLARADRVARELIEYFGRTIEERRTRPREDFLGALIAAEEQGERLSMDELLSTVILLLVAGHETTMNLIGNGLLALLRHPEQRVLLEREPALAESAVEELLRFDSPVQMAIRRASAPIELGPATIPEGAEVLVLLGAANRDPARYAEPDALDLRRDNAQPMFFGAGAHFCLGAALARLAGRIALPTLLRRLPGLSLPPGVTPDDLEWNGNVSLRGLRALPVVFG